MTILGILKLAGGCLVPPSHQRKGRAGQEPPKPGLGVPAPLRRDRCTHRGSRLAAPVSSQPAPPDAPGCASRPASHPCAHSPGGAAWELQVEDPGGFTHGDRSGSEHPRAVHNQNITPSHLPGWRKGPGAATMLPAPSRIPPAVP